MSALTCNCCSCGAPLEIVSERAGYRASCPRCTERAARGEGDGFIVAVTGYGATPGSALKDYRQRVETF